MLYQILCLTLAFTACLGQIHHAPAVITKAAQTDVVIEERPPQPYSFGYNIDDGFGNNQFRKEDGDDFGAKKGSYGYKDANGIFRQVEYVADGLGFRAVVKTNEPGTADIDPADVELYAQDPPVEVVPVELQKAAPLIGLRPHPAPLLVHGPTVHHAPLHHAPLHHAPVHHAPVHH